ncbi:hypothetical protein P376_2458 [Streptomyces sp. HCCB10043]|nr:hypothetical protein P376_2458 [Streptomyces sp. HCCB10043]
MRALTAATSVGSGVAWSLPVWAARQGRQRPSGRASGRPGRPQSVHSIRRRGAGVPVPGDVFGVVVGSWGGILSVRRRRTKRGG